MAHAHAGMDHGHMDHGHGDMDMGGKCSMNMLFTWSTKDLCIVFRGWRITGTWSLILSLLAIVLLTAGYEAVREASRRYDLHAKSMIEGRRGGDDLTRRTATGSTNEQQFKIINAIFYAIQVFYSFFIMLLFMTYNGWIMLSVAVGAFVGYMLFANSSPTKSAACH